MSETKYKQGIGRRKEATAVVRLVKGKGNIIINKREYKEYFTRTDLQTIVTSPFDAIGEKDAYDVEALVKGGGIVGQAESVRLGISRALLISNPDLRPSLKKLGYLKRDARKRERKKPGRRTARKKEQWSKR
ncbi:MAG: 30S ribosomal protein S9 [uncultured bacterium]|nr:MAG: 30S ribosomal protein S9 [uncultured bacterium]HBD05587.1 30S ribosomal protein S9 [Candidatus Uhrbacteria bacterium]